MRALILRSSVLGLAVAAGFGLAPGTLAAPQQGVAEEAPAEAQEQPRQIEVEILGMSCPFCAYGAQKKLKKLEGVKELTVELESGLATLTMEAAADVPNDTLRKVIDEAGFEVAAISRSFESEHPDWKRDEGTAGTS